MELVKKRYVVLFLLFSLQLNAQLISIKSVPVATGDQFMIFPNRFNGMAGVSIALPDPLADPFGNPVRGQFLKENVLTASPVYYRIADGNGSARTIPLSLQLNREHWFGGVHLTAQDLDVTEDNNFVSNRLKNKSLRNFYGSMYFGFPLNQLGLTVGVSAFYASLEGMDGVELLYPGSQNIEQDGHSMDVRLGIHRQIEKQKSFEALFIYNDFKMKHDVIYQNWFWGWDEMPPGNIEKHTDHSRTHGLHLNYKQPVTKSGWIMGTMATVNRKSHPKIPNYELMNIPRDPGDSWAYNFGIGLSREKNETIFGVDFIYEPIFSTTWADALTDIATRTGRTLKAGQRTIENEFTFSNTLLRFGLSHGPNGRGFQLGLQAHSYKYWLDQYDYVEEFRRKQKEQWTEWTFFWGWFREFDNFELRYTGRMITGTGRPGVTSTAVFDRAVNFSAKNDILLAPDGALTLDETAIYTHQIILIIPLDKL